MSYELLKTFHLIFIITWFSGLFYLVRLFVYHQEAVEKNYSKDLINQFKVMERRLWYYITLPSAILSLVFGFSLLKYFPIKLNHWLHFKLVLVFILIFYNYFCGYFVAALKKNQCQKSSKFFRMYNEIATLILFMIVPIVVFKEVYAAIYGIAAFFIFGFLIVITMKFLEKKN